MSHHWCGHVTSTTPQYESGLGVVDEASGGCYTIRGDTSPDTQHISPDIQNTSPDT